MNRIDGTTALVGVTAEVGVPTKTTHWWSKANGIAHATMDRITPRTTGGSRMNHYPEHYGFLEQSCLAREMRHP